MAKKDEKPPPPPPDPIDLMTPKELQQFVLKNIRDLEMIREERNFFMLERDKLNTFWNIARKQLSEEQEQLRTKELEIEEMKQNHFVAVKNKNQQVKYDELELNKEKRNLNAAREQFLKDKEANLIEEEIEMAIARRDVAKAIIQKELSYEQLIRELKAKGKLDIQNLTKMFEEKIAALIKKYHKWMEVLKKELDLKRRIELHQLEEIKNDHLKDFMDDHLKSIKQMKEYFKSVVLKHLAVIQNLQAEVQATNDSNNAMKELRKHQLEENKILRVFEKKSVSLERRFSIYERDVASLKLIRRRIIQKEKEIEVLKADNEDYYDKLTIEQTKRKDLYNNFVETLRNLQDQLGLKTMCLEKMVPAYAKAQERYEKQLEELEEIVLPPKIVEIEEKKEEKPIETKVEVVKKREPTQEEDFEHTCFD